jgi:hypothetical protein
MRPHHLVKGALIPDLDRLLYAPVLDDEEAPLLRIRAIGRALSRLEDPIDECIGYGVGLESPHCPRRVDDLEELGAVGHGIHLFPIIFVARVAPMIAPSRRRVFLFWLRAQKQRSFPARALPRLVHLREPPRCAKADLCANREMAVDDMIVYRYFWQWPDFRAPAPTELLNPEFLSALRRTPATFRGDSQLSLRSQESDRSPSLRTRVGHQLEFRRPRRLTAEGLFVLRVAA